VTELKLESFIQAGGIEPFSVDRFLPAEPARLTFLVMHGAGKADRKRMYPVCERLAKNGYEAWTFDFYGHGESQVQLGETSLYDRCQQAALVLRGMASPVALLTFSMAGQTAVDLLKDGFDIHSMFLFAPAAYDQEATHKKFGPEFSEVIRRPNSWKNSTSFVTLKGFTGHLALIWGTEDSVIPLAIVENLCQSATLARSREIIKLEGAPHTLSGWFLEDAEAADRVISDVIQRIKQ
jgi:pimeloyl-ACP methyl ester carboxylesterase